MAARPTKAPRRHEKAARGERGDKNGLYHAGASTFSSPALKDATERSTQPDRSCFRLRRPARQAPP